MTSRSLALLAILLLFATCALAIDMDDLQTHVNQQDSSLEANNGDGSTSVNTLRTAAANRQQSKYFGGWKHCYASAADSSDGEETNGYLTGIAASVQYFERDIPEYINPDAAGISFSLQATILPQTVQSVAGSNQTLGGVTGESGVMRRPIMAARNTTFWQFELWHENTGAKIQYKGPYDTCCDFLVGGRCEYHFDENHRLIDYTTDCDAPKRLTVFTAAPGGGETFTARVSKALPTAAPGKYEATLMLYQYVDHIDADTGEVVQRKDDILCIDVPFEVVDQPQQQQHYDSQSQQQQQQSTDSTTGNDSEKQQKPLALP